MSVDRRAGDGVAARPPSCYIAEAIASDGGRRVNPHDTVHGHDYRAGMRTSILGLGTAVPDGHLSQPVVRDFFASQPGTDRLARRLIGSVFDHSAIDSRYSVIGEIGAQHTLFTDDDGNLLSPTTGDRNALYRRDAPALSATAARTALARSHVAAADVTHVVTASCTGFFAPGPDFRLVQDLGLEPTVERYHIGFMGCAAAFPALRAATRIADAQPGSVVLVVCTELCSLHIRSSSDPEQIVASAVFGDGAGAAVVSSRAPLHEGALFEIGDFSTAITTEGEADMDWTIGDRGFEMRLTAEVPRIIGREIRGVVEAMFPGVEDAAAEVDAWAVHPGGRSVLDRVQDGLSLVDAAMEDSRAVLRDYGNMSSATILFILERILADDALADGADVVGLCFGPGLTVETAQFTRRASPAADEAAR